MEGLKENDKKLMKNLKCEIFMNETQFEDDVMEETQENTSLQIERRTMSINDEKRTKQIFLFPKSLLKR
jgi:hypothetical protein